MITYEKRELINTSGVSVGFGYEKLVDGIVERGSYAWDNRYNTEAECDSAVRFLTIGAKHTNAYATMAEDEKEIVRKLWTMTREELVAFGRSNTNDRLTYSARYIFWDRFARFGGSLNGGNKPVSADDFFFRFVEPSGSTSDRVDPNTVETCGRCGGTGIYVGAGIVENGVFKGFTGTCFRCKGKGKCTHAANELGEKGRGNYAARQIAGDMRRSSCTCESASDRTRAGYMDTFTTSEGCPVHDPNYEADED
jgi:hypothetical protein